MVYLLPSLGFREWNSVCFKYAKARKAGVCRLSFSPHGRLLASFTHIGIDGKIEPERGTTVELYCFDACMLLW